jgi:predicted DNA-binding protein
MRPTKSRSPGRPKGAPAKSASFRLPEELLAKLAEVSRKQDRSQTTLVKRALEAYLAEHGREE